MFSSKKEMDLDEIVQKHQVNDSTETGLIATLEQYGPQVKKLRKDLHQLRKRFQKLKQEQTTSPEPSGSSAGIIHSFSRVLTRKLMLNEIVQELNKATKKILPYQNSAICLSNHGVVSFVPTRTNGRFRSFLEKLQEEGKLNWMWEQDNPVLLPAIEISETPDAVSEEEKYLITPLVSDNQKIGLYFLYLSRRQAQKCKYEDIENIQTLCNLSAVVISRALLQQQLAKLEKSWKSSQNQVDKLIPLAILGELTGGIAHEINNPLQIILGNIQMAQLGFEPEKSLKIIEKQTLRIANIIRGLLSMAQHPKGKNEEYIEIDSVIQNAFNLIRGQLEKRNIKLLVNSQPNLPIIQGDSVFLQQIFLNLLLTSKKQIERNGEIHLDCSAAEDDYLLIKYSDTGKPLNEEILNSLSPRAEGNVDLENTSIGLLVTAQMLRKIGGDFTFSSDKGQGNLFFLKIPRNFMQTEVDKVYKITN